MSENRKDQGPSADQEEQERDDILRCLLKMPPQQRPKREREERPAKRKGGDKG